MALVEDKEYKDEIVGEVEEGHEEKDKEVVLYADHGLSIVLQHNLRLASEEIKNDWLRTDAIYL